MRIPANDKNTCRTKVLRCFSAKQVPVSEPPILAAGKKESSNKYQQAESKKIDVIFGPEGRFLALYKNYK